MPKQSAQQAENAVEQAGNTAKKTKNALTKVENIAEKSTQDGQSDSAVNERTSCYEHKSGTQQVCPSQSCLSPDVDMHALLDDLDIVGKIAPMCKQAMMSFHELRRTSAR